MQPIKSSDFRSNNQVLFQAKILQNQQFSYSIDRGALGYSQVKSGSCDVIDINQDNRAEFTFGGIPKVWGGVKETFNEPVLTQSFEEVETYGNRYNTEVVTQDDINLKNLQIEDTTLYGKSDKIENKIVGENQRSIETLVDKLEPFEPNAKWAIDIVNQEFLIYKPKK